MLKYADAGDEASSMAAIDAVSRFAAGSDAAMAAVLGDAALVESWLELSPRPKLKAFTVHSVAYAMAPALYSSEDVISRTFEQVTVTKVHASIRLPTGAI